MDNRRIAAIIVLTAGLPGRIDLAKRMVTVFGANDPTTHYAFEPADEDRPVPIPEEDWPIRIVREVRMSSAAKVTVTRKVEVAPIPTKPPDG